MKTTIQIADSLLQEARRVAERENTTLRALVEQGLRRTLAERKTPTGFRLRKASFRGNGLQPEFAARSWEEIRNASYEGHGG